MGSLFALGVGSVIFELKGVEEEKVRMRGYQDRDPLSFIVLRYRNR